jgi:subtilisin family serine protease
MRNSKTAISLFLQVLIISWGAMAWAQNGNPVGNPAREVLDDANNSFIFVFDPAKIKSADEVRGRALGLSKAHGAQVRHVFTNALWGFSATISKQGAERLAANAPFLAYYEPNGVAWAIGKPVAPQKRRKPGSGGGGETTEPAEVIPAGILRVGGPVNSTGQAWIIDTGIDLSNADLNVGSGANFVLRGKNSANDGNGHGTHVAGTIAAIDNEIGVVGVAAGATVHPIRVLNNSGSGTIDGVVAGIDYVAGQARPEDCVNLSLGASGHFDSLHDAIYSAAYGDPVNNVPGLRFAIAAGNSSADAKGFEPAHIEHANVFTVSAVDANDAFASFSNFGSPVDFAAPGVGILSTKRGGGVTTLSGTSMAAPHVCGVLLLSNTQNADGVASGDPDSNPDPIASAN